MTSMKFPWVLGVQEQRKRWGGAVRASLCLGKYAFWGERAGR